MTRGAASSPSHGPPPEPLFGVDSAEEEALWSAATSAGAANAAGEASSLPLPPGPPPAAGRRPIRSVLPGTAVAGRALWTFGTQGLSSGSNFVLTAVVLAVAPPRGFAVFSICLTSYLLLLQFARYVIAVPVLVAEARSQSAGQDADRAARNAMTGFAALAGLVAGPPLLLVALLWREAAPQFLLLAAAMPFLLVQDSLRHVAIGSGRPKLAAAADGAWVGLQVVGFSVAIVVGVGSAAALLGIWAGAGALSAMLLGVLLHARPVLGQSTRWLRDNIEVCRRLAVEFVVNSGSYYALSYGLAVFAGAEQLGYLRAAQTLFGPASVVLMSGATLGVPESVRIRKRGSGLVRFAFLLSGSLTVLALGCGAAVYVLLPAVGPHLFPSWRAVREVMPWLTLFGAAIGAGAGPISSLRALSASRWVLTARTLTSGLALLIGLPASVWLGAKGALLGLALGECVLSVRAWVRLRHDPEVQRAAVG